MTIINDITTSNINTITNTKFKLLSFSLTLYYFTTILSIKKNFLDELVYDSIQPPRPPQLSILSTYFPILSTITNRFRTFLSYFPISTLSISRSESLILSLTDLILSKLILKYLKISNFNNFLFGTTSILSTTATIATSANRLNVLLNKYKKKSLIQSIGIALAIMGLHELFHITIICLLGGESWQASKKRKKSNSESSREIGGRSLLTIDEDDEELWGIEIRGKSLPITTSIESNSIEVTECAICLRTNSTSTSEPLTTSSSSNSSSDTDVVEELDPLELFCTSCITPIRRSCLLHWWNTVQSTSTTSSNSAATAPINDNETIRLPSQMTENGIITWNSIIIHNGSITTFSSSLNSNYNSNSTSVTNSNNLVQTGEILLPQEGIWGLGKIQSAILGIPSTPSSSTNPTNLKQSITIYLSQEYILKRKKNQFWFPFESNLELEQIRNSLLSSSSTSTSSPSSFTSDPIIAHLHSSSPGPTCPTCRSTLSLFIHLIQPPPLPPSSSTSSNSTNTITRIIKSNKRLNTVVENIIRGGKIWKDKFGFISLSEKFGVACLVQFGLRGLSDG